MHGMKAVAVDDEQLNLKIVEAMGNEIGLDVVSFLRPDDLLEYAVKNSAAVDLYFIDFKMPEMNGIELIRHIRRIHDDVPVVMITSVTNDDDLMVDAIESGATEFLKKPLNIVEFKARVNNLLKLRWSTVLLKDRAKHLEDEVRNAVSDIAIREQETLQILGRVADYKDIETGAHVQRVALYSRFIAKLIGENSEFQDVIFNAAPLHDIGKIGIPDSVLSKPGKLGAAEISVMRRHPFIGYEILKNSATPYLKAGAIISLTHHEHYDGKGYPNGTAGEDIHIYGRIVALCDVFDALSSGRPYKEPWPPELVIKYIMDQRGKHFDPRLTDMFIKNISYFEGIYRQFV